MDRFVQHAVFHRLSRLGQAISALRQGGVVHIAPDIVIQAAENLGAYNLPQTPPDGVRLVFAGMAEQAADLVHNSPVADWLAGCAKSADPAIDPICFDLARQAEILPWLLVWRGDATAAAISLTPNDWAQRSADEAAMILPVLTTPVALDHAEQTRITLFRVPGLGAEHLAILIGTPEQQNAPLVRVHSQCVTGDLLGSLRCDCGPQLRGAVRQMGQQEGGIILYMAHEGRAIGLGNKLRAYGLQDGGLDTVEANLALGYDVDNRDYVLAAAMLRCLGVQKIRLLTNNPQKIEGLHQSGIEIIARVPHILGANHHNHDYLRTKREKTGHMF